MNWKRIIGFAAILFASQVLAGFIEAGFSGTDAAAVKRQLLLATCLTLGLSVSVFAAMSFRQDHRPFLHGVSALLLTEAFSFALAAAFPAWLGGTPVVLLVFDWLTLAAGLIAGTFLGRYMASFHRRGRADA